MLPEGKIYKPYLTPGKGDLSLYHKIIGRRDLTILYKAHLNIPTCIHIHPNSLHSYICNFKSSIKSPSTYLGLIQSPRNVSFYLSEHIIYFYIKGFGFPRWAKGLRTFRWYFNLINWPNCCPKQLNFLAAFKYVCFAVLNCSVCLTFCNPMECSPPGSSGRGVFSNQNIGVGCQALLQGIFLTQGSNPGLLHCRQILYCLSHQGSPNWGK